MLYGSAKEPLPPPQKKQQLTLRRRVDALEAGDYDATGLEEVDLAERFTQSLLEGASEGH